MKRYLVRIPQAIIMLPVMLAGFLYRLTAEYFIAGTLIYGICDDELEKWLDK